MAQIITKASSGAGKPQLGFYTNAELPSLGPQDVLVKFLAAPINPLDVLVLADLYPVKPEHHYKGEPIPGYDGVGEIVKAGAAVEWLTAGDLVIPSKFGIGTWRTQAVLDARSVQKISRPADLAFGAIIRISIAPAFCLVEDMCELKPGDWIVQNAATSVVAQMVVQFARRRGVRVISVIRDRPGPQASKVKSSLLQGGAEMVVTEAELENSTEIKSKRIKLALDSVFGDSARRLVKALSPGGTYVQLGFLGGAASTLKLDAPNDIFGRQLTLKAFRGSAQVGLRTLDEQTDLFNWFITLFNQGELHLPQLGLEIVSWNAGKTEGTEDILFTAVLRAQEGKLGQRKQILLFK